MRGRNKGHSRSAGIASTGLWGKMERLIASGQEVKLHVGCGPVRFDGFIHVDLNPHRPDVFKLDASEPWPVPNSVVDYIFHEDFLEHLNQRQQFRFLAETYRMMRPGAIQYVSLPNIEWVMMERSEFHKGAIGVYDEWRLWKHELLHSYSSLEEMANLVGFEVEHAERHPLATRPASDRCAKRDANAGNVIAHLVKRDDL